MNFATMLCDRWTDLVAASTSIKMISKRGLEEIDFSLPSIGGPVEKMSFFQIVHMTKVSTQIHSSISQYDVDKVSSKKNDHNLTVGCLND